MKSLPNNDKALTRNLIVPLLILLSSLIYTNVASAFEYNTFLGNPVGWNGSSATMHASVASFPIGDPFTDALETVISRLNKHPSNFNFNLVLGSPTWGLDNSQNEVWFAEGNLFTPPAICYYWTSFGNIIEADVIFYSPCSLVLGKQVTITEFTPYMDKSLLTTYNGTFRSFKTTAMHEFGHALGLMHENDEYNIMGDDWNHIHLNGNVCKAYFGEDASDGAVAIYGVDGNAGMDVSVSHFKRVGTDGEYSKHDFTKLFDSDDFTIDNTILATGERLYEVYPGQSLQAEFTYENNGLANQTADIGFYISDDNTIDTSDDLIKTKQLTIERDDVYTKKYTVTIPTNLTIGYIYYLGVIIDDTDSINEIFEKNNASYHKALPGNAHLTASKFFSDFHFR